MKRKLSTQIFSLQFLFIYGIVGISVLLYMVLMPIYYEYVKDDQIMQAYHDIGELDLSGLEETDYSLFVYYENENLHHV